MVNCIIIMLCTVQDGRSWQMSELGTLVEYLIVAITIVVVAVPEG